MMSRWGIHGSNLMSARAGGRFTRADALLEEGMIICVHCESKIYKLIERCPNPECPSREKYSIG